MDDKAKRVLKYALGIVGLIFIILCIIAFVILVIPVKEVEDAPAHVMTSLQELEDIKKNNEPVDNLKRNSQGKFKNVIDENKIEIGGEYEGEINVTDYEPAYIYVSENTKYINLVTSEELTKEDIENGDILIIEGDVYKPYTSTYVQTYIDTLTGTIKIFKASEHGKMRNDYFLNKKEIEDVRMVSNRIPRRVSLAYDKEINGEIVPLVQLFETNGNKIKEVTENSILDITLEEPLKENDEKNPGLIVDFKVHY